MKGWRTILFNVLGMVTVVATSDYAQVIPQRAMPWIGLGIGVGNLVLRSVTTTPIGQKEP